MTLLQIVSVLRTLRDALSHKTEKFEAQIRLAELEREEREREREHQRVMLETIFTKMVEFAEKNAEPLRELAQAQKANSDVLNTWLKGFQVASPEPIPSSTVREEDEFFAAMKRDGAIPKNLEVPKDIPPELQMAWVLQQIEKDSESFDRGS